MLKEARDIQKKAAKLGFDWERVEDVFIKIEEEIGELKNAYKDQDEEKLLEELGDLLFAVVNLSRFIEVDSDEAIERAVEKFKERFAHIEKELKLKGKPMTLAQMDEIWERAKK